MRSSLSTGMMCCKTETIEVVKMPLAEAVEQVVNGSAIIHGATCILLLKANRLLDG